MSENLEPQTKTETYLAAISGDYAGELPKPVTKEHVYLKKIAQNGMGSSSEIADSRTGADGTNYDTLKQRLDAEKNSIDEVLTRHITLTESEYNAIPEEEKNNGTYYYIVEEVTV